MLGNHRIVTGDARDERVYARLMQSQMATMAFLDLPDNVRINGHVGGRGDEGKERVHSRFRRNVFEQYIAFLKQALALCARHTGDGAISYVTIDWRHSLELLSAGGINL